jgi:Carboxymuconolactone decarboxylase family
VSGEKRAGLPDYIEKVSELGLKIRLIQDADATGDTAAVYDEWRAKTGRQKMPGILKCFGQRPDFLRQVMQFSDTVHFSEGHLSRRYKEMIASYVSYLNRCPY